MLLADPLKVTAHGRTHGVQQEAMSHPGVVWQGEKLLGGMTKGQGGDQGYAKCRLVRA